MMLAKRQTTDEYFARLWVGKYPNRSGSASTQSERLGSSINLIERKNGVTLQQVTLECTVRRKSSDLSGGQVPLFKFLLPNNLKLPDGVTLQTVEQTVYDSTKTFRPFRRPNAAVQCLHPNNLILQSHT